MAMVGFLCAGLGVAVPAALFLDYTDRQGDPPATPTEAADLYLIQLDQGEEIGLRRALASGRRDELLDQWRELKATVERSEPPDKLEWSAFDIQDQGDGKTGILAQLDSSGGTASSIHCSIRRASASSSK